MEFCVHRRTVTCNDAREQAIEKLPLGLVAVCIQVRFLALAVLSHGFNRWFVVWS